MAGALVGEAFLSAALQALFDRVASREFLSLFSGRKQSEKLLEKLKLTLLTLRAVLNDAEDKQITNKAVSDWLDELKDAFYHADDLVDEIATLALQAKLQTRSQRVANQVSNFISSSPFSSKGGITSRLKEMVEKMEYFAAQKDTLGLKENVQIKHLQVLQTSSLVDESDICGRDGDKEKIIELLLSDYGSSSGIRVIPIVGMGGVGKTTLAQLAYNDSRVTENFDLKAWVCVSQEFDVTVITKKIVEALTESTSYRSDLESLQVELKYILKLKKFLLVLDDIWNEDYMQWDILRRPFINGAKDSKIMVTTRSQDVARVVATAPSHQMEKLAFEDCWSLFSKHAFEDVDFDAHPTLKMMGEKIVEKCKGLPLAVKSLGGLLRGKLDPKEWDDVLKSEIWDLQGDCILPALRLSYHYLPPHLKRCFAYCSIFPKDYEFEKEELFRLWIAEELVEQPKSNKSIDDECNFYFNQLLSRCFFHQSSCTYHGKTYSWIVMHDLIHDLAQHISGEFCFRLEDYGKSHNISKRVRYFSYVREEYDPCEKFKNIHDNKCLRTFISFDRFRAIMSYLRTEDSLLEKQILHDAWPSLMSRDIKFSKKLFHDLTVSLRGGDSLLSNKMLRDILPRLRCLRVLSLSRYDISELPESIGDLIHLRYLDLSRTHIKLLPDSITNLCNLQTLNLSCCKFLTKLPEDMEKLINLQFLDTRGTGLVEMPMQMSRLKGLQCLPHFVVGKSTGSRISGLRKLDHIRGKLCISGLQNVVDDREAAEANLKEKTCLLGLMLNWSGSTSHLSPGQTGNANDREKEKDVLVLDKLQPPQGVMEIEIWGYRGTRFSNWLGDNSVCKVVSLSILHCVYCDSLPALGQLRSLKYLKIKGMKGIRKVGGEFYGNVNNPFQCLESLTFEDMPEWEEWDVPDCGELPRLSDLSIRQCPVLRGQMPSQLPSLRALRIQCQGFEEFERTMQHTSLPSLQELNIEGLINLIQMPPQLSRLTSLQELKVRGCPKLVSFPDMGLPPNLRTLEIEECEALRCLPKGMMRINTCLQHVNIYSCPSLVPFPIDDLPASLKQISIKSCENLVFSSNDYHTSIEKLKIAYSFDLMQSLPLGCFPNLTYLYISNCQSLQTLLIPNGLQNLKQLRIASCPNIVAFAEGGLDAPNLIQISISRCKRFKSLPRQMHTLPSLQSLAIYGCSELESFPGAGLPSNLLALHIKSCKKLKSLPERMETILTSLQSLEIGSCPELESFSDSGLPSNLHSLSIRHCAKLKSVPQPAHMRLASLQYLTLTYCPDLESFLEGGLPSNLRSLEIWNCKKLNRCLMGWNLQRLPSLEQFRLEEDDSLVSFTEEWLLPASLTSLEIRALANLKSLKGLQRLTYLESLKIDKCPKLLSLPEEGLPSSLSSLTLSGCPLLIPHCQRKKGKYWPKIAHIPFIKLDREVILD